MIRVDKDLEDDDAVLAANDTAVVKTVSSSDEGLLYTFYSKCVKWIAPTDCPHTKRWCSLFQRCAMATLPKDHMVMIMLCKKGQAPKKGKAVPKKTKSATVFLVVN